MQSSIHLRREAFPQVLLRKRPPFPESFFAQVSASVAPSANPLQPNPGATFRVAKNGTSFVFDTSTTRERDSATDERQQIPGGRAFPRPRPAGKSSPQNHGFGDYAVCLQSTIDRTMGAPHRVTQEQHRTLIETSRLLVDQSRELIKKSKALTRPLVAKQQPLPPQS